MGEKVVIIQKNRKVVGGGGKFKMYGALSRGYMHAHMVYDAHAMISYAHKLKYFRI